jgi:hypothetical protein
MIDPHTRDEYERVSDHAQTLLASLGTSPGADMSLSAGAQAAPSKAPYVKDAGFDYGPAEFDIEGEYVLRVLLANMAAGGNVRVCVSGVCRKAPARNRVFMNEQQYGQRWLARQTRSVVIAACNRAGCMRPLTSTPDPGLSFHAGPNGAPAARFADRRASLSQPRRTTPSTMALRATSQTPTPRDCAHGATFHTPSR